MQVMPPWEPLSRLPTPGRTLYDENHYQCMIQGFDCYYQNNCINSTETQICPLQKTYSVPPPNPSGLRKDCHFNSGAGRSGISSNDSSNESQCVAIKPEFANPENALHDRLEITYRVDGSCKRINHLLAKCTKHYVQGQFDARNMQVDDHSPGTQSFRIPNYADTSKLIQVFVDGIRAFKGSDWEHPLKFPPYHQL